MLDKHQELTGQIIKAFFIVYNTLGYGFLEVAQLSQSEAIRGGTVAQFWAETNIHA